MEIKDIAVRAMTQDGSFRIIAIRTTDTVRQTIAAQKVKADNAATFAELLTGAVLVRQTMAPQHRVQAILRSKAPGGLTMVADSLPEGMTRGLINNQDLPGVTLEFGEETLLQIIRVLFNNELQQGIIATPEEGGISNALTQYMLTSEQVTSVIEVAASMKDGEVTSAGGFIVQLLPEAHAQSIEQMLERLESRTPLIELLGEHGMHPSALIAELLEGIEHTILGDEPVFHGCTCSELRLVSAMTTLGQDDLRAIVEEGGVIDVTCEYCQTPYRLGAEQLRPLLEKQ